MKEGAYTQKKEKEQKQFRNGEAWGFESNSSCKLFHCGDTQDGMLVRKYEKKKQPS